MAKTNDIGDKKHIFFLMFLFHKIRLPLNMAPEGLLWHLTVSGDAPRPAFGMLTPATHHSVPFSSDRRIAGRELVQRK